MGDVVKTVIYIVIALWLWGKLKGSGTRVNTSQFNSGIARRG
jgi:hypothetical protein